MAFDNTNQQLGPCCCSLVYSEQGIARPDLFWTCAHLSSSQWWPAYPVEVQYCGGGQHFTQHDLTPLPAFNDYWSSTTAMGSPHSASQNANLALDCPKAQSGSPSPAPSSSPAAGDDSEYDGLSDANKDDSDDLPYNQLIWRCLIAAPNHELRLQQIYEWFDRHTNKKHAPRSHGWQNSIRHNLSMNDAFEKGSRDGTAPATKNMWHLTDDAIDRGIQPTTRYRKVRSSGTRRKSLRRDAPMSAQAPTSRQQLSGRKGGHATRRSLMAYRGALGSSPLLASPENDLASSDVPLSPLSAENVPILRSNDLETASAFFTDAPASSTFTAANTARPPNDGFLSPKHIYDDDEADTTAGADALFINTNEIDHADAGMYFPSGYSLGAQEQSSEDFEDSFFITAATAAALTKKEDVVGEFEPVTMMRSDVPSTLSIGGFQQQQQHYTMLQQSTAASASFSGAGPVGYALPWYPSSAAPSFQQFSAAAQPNQQPVEQDGSYTSLTCYLGDVDGYGHSHSGIVKREPDSD